jgi:hypothetical protein
MNDEVVRIDDREPRRARCPVVFHHGGIAFTLARYIMAEGDVERVSLLVDAQLVHRVGLPALEDGLNDREAEVPV